MPKALEARVVVTDDGGEREVGVFPAREARAIARRFNRKAEKQGKAWRATAILLL